MLVVIDTNIIVNALKSSTINSKAMRLLDDLFHGVYTICVSSAIMDEYIDVLNRPHLGLSQSAISDIIRWIDTHAYHIEPLPTNQEKIPMKDESDRIFYDVAKCLNARLITRNYKDYPVDELITLIDEIY